MDKQVKNNIVIAVVVVISICIGYALGYFGKIENSRIASKMKQVFSVWIDNGHNNFDDVNTCILCIKLTSGILFSNGIRYEIDFTE